MIYENKCIKKPVEFQWSIWVFLLIMVFSVI